MELPKAVRMVGTIEKTRIIYIEDYVLQYLTVCEEEETQKDAETILYGKKEISGEVDVYMIYGIYKQAGRDCAERGGLEKKGIGENGKVEEKEKKFNKKYRRLGYLNRETGAIVLDDLGEGQTLKGYYIFYDADERMKDYLGEYYERQLWQKKQNSSRASYVKKSPVIAEAEQSGSAELVALSNAEREKEFSPFLWIRMAVICIFIVFCAIAVTTVNGFDKLNDFIQTAVWAGEIIDTP